MVTMATRLMCHCWSKHMLMSCCQSAKSFLFFPSVHNFSSSYLGTSSWCLSFAVSRPELVPPFCFRFFIRVYSSLLFYLTFLLFSFCFANCNTPIMCSPSSPHNESYIWRQCFCLLFIPFKDVSFLNAASRVYTFLFLFWRISIKQKGKKYIFSTILASFCRCMKLVSDIKSGA
jgi:hypothetical protein